MKFKFNSQEDKVLKPIRSNVELKVSDRNAVNELSIKKDDFRTFTDKNTKDEKELSNLDTRSRFFKNSDGFTESNFDHANKENKDQRARNITLSITKTNLNELENEINNLEAHLIYKETKKLTRDTDIANNLLTLDGIWNGYQRDNWDLRDVILKANTDINVLKGKLRKTEKENAVLKKNDLEKTNQLIDLRFKVENLEAENKRKSQKASNYDDRTEEYENAIDFLKNELKCKESLLENFKIELENLTRSTQHDKKNTMKMRIDNERLNKENKELRNELRMLHRSIEQIKGRRQ